MHAVLIVLGMLVAPSSAIRITPFKKLDNLPMIDQSLYSCCPPHLIEDFVSANFTNSAKKAPFHAKELEHAHSSDHQDLFLYEHIFRYLPSGGHFIEFGGRDGSEYSNTWFYEKVLGWDGVLIEAMYQSPEAMPWDGQGDPWFLKEMQKTRKCRVNGLDASACIFAAVSNTDGKFLTLANTKDPDYKDKLDATLANDDNGIVGGGEDTMRMWETDSGVEGARNIPTVTLNSIIKRFQLKDVNLLSVDCEGCEKKAFEGLDLVTNPIKVILLERGNSESPGDYCLNHKLLRDHGYLNFQGPGYDEVYIHPDFASQIPEPPKLPFERTNEHPDNCADTVAWKEWPVAA